MSRTSSQFRLLPAVVAVGHYAKNYSKFSPADIESLPVLHKSFVAENNNAFIASNFIPDILNKGDCILDKPSEIPIYLTYS